MVSEIARRYQGPIHTFAPYAPASDRKGWEGLPEKLRKNLIAQGEQVIDYNYPMLPATKYMEFCRIGNRSMFEDIYFTRRRVLNALVLAECCENKGRFLDTIINGVMAICEESGWQLPAHNYYPGWAHLCIPDNSDPVSDLFSCETGAQLAMVSWLLKEQLDSVTPLIDERIRREVRARTVEPFLSGRHHWGWMGAPGAFVNNWTPWCTQNTLIACLSDPQLDRATKRQLIVEAAQCLDYFLDSYGEDGCCNEGASYYRAAGLCLFNAIEVLNACTDNAFAGLYEQTKVKNIAPYIMNVHVDDRYYANFADCAPTAGRAGARDFLFAKRVGNEEMMRYAAIDHQADDGERTKRSENLFYRLQAAFTEAEISSYDTSRPPVKKDIYYESVGLLIARDGHLFLAAKAGGNDDSHNHNDTGSITVYRDGRPMLIDVGVETYSRKTFSPERYDIWTMQSQYHNVMTFGDVMQLAGHEYAAKVEDAVLEEGRAAMRMELSACYPAGTVESYQREVEFIKGKSITVTDRFSPAAEGTFLTLMTLNAPTAGDSCLQIEGQGEITFTGAGRMEVEKITITDPKLLGEWGDTLYRTRIYPTGSELKFVIQ
ncbi:MAG: heparinase [Provencibacterium sp.]|jgi:hypothetical protein|nr:heparinase [Provencibacterium sp.]